MISFGKSCNNLYAQSDAINNEANLRFLTQHGKARANHKCYPDFETFMINMNTQEESDGDPDTNDDESSWLLFLMKFS